MDTMDTIVTRIHICYDVHRLGASDKFLVVVAMSIRSIEQQQGSIVTVPQPT